MQSKHYGLILLVILALGGVGATVAFKKGTIRGAEPKPSSPAPATAQPQAKGIESVTKNPEALLAPQNAPQRGDPLKDRVATLEQQLVDAGETAKRALASANEQLAARDAELQKLKTAMAESSQKMIDNATQYARAIAEAKSALAQQKKQEDDRSLAVEAVRKKMVTVNP